MKYTDLNRNIDIGSSAHYIEMGGFRILLDAGLHPKKMGYDSLPDYSVIGKDTLDFIGISHAHLDHIGSLPVIARRQNFARILCSEHGRGLVGKMLRSSRSVMKKQRDEFNIKEYPLYDRSEIDEVNGNILPMMFFKERIFELDGNKISFRFYPSGHILGSSAIEIESGKELFLYTGDMSFHSTHILKGANIPCKKYDVMLVETTRGMHKRLSYGSYESESGKLVESITRTIKDGGNVLIPVFALGRMQEVLSLLKKSRENRILPDCPIYISGLGLDIAEFFAYESKKCGMLNFDRSCLDIAKPLREDIIAGRNFEDRGIYLLGSGMMVENTPSYFAASAIMEHSENAIFFVGYCDEDTPAGRLLKTNKGEDFSFDNIFYNAKLNCKVERYDLTAHADREEMLSFILERDPRCVILTHGSEESRDWFFYNLLDMSPKTNIIIAEPSVEMLI